MKQKNEFFEAFHRFRKLDITSMFPELSGSDFRTLMTIECVGKEKEGKGVRVSELAQQMRVAAPAASRTLKGLEERGMIERSVDTEDRRNTYVFLTKKGKEVLADAEQIMNDFSHAVFERLDEEKMEHLIAYLKEVYEVSAQEIKKRAVAKPPKDGKRQDADIA